jgi:hypothetical protein
MRKAAEREGKAVLEATYTTDHDFGQTEIRMTAIWRLT